MHVTTTDMSLALLLGPQLRAYSAAGFEVIVCSADGPYVAELESWGLRHLPLRYATRANDPLADLRMLGELVALFRRLRPDIVHTHNPKPGILGRMAARLTGVPAVVNTVHGLYAQSSDSWPRRTVVYTAERLAAACSDIELVQNPEDLDTLARLRVPGPKLRLLGNGVDLERFSTERLDPTTRNQVRAEFGVGSSEIVAGVVGRLVFEKGYRELIAAAESWMVQDSSIRLVVVGPRDDAKADAIDDRSIERAQRRGVRFLGPRQDMERVYSGFDIYVLASHREGFPRSAMEAAAMALPIVATDIRGCRQVVDHGVTGLLVPPRDPSSLAQGVLRLAASGSERTAMGRAGRLKAIREFNQDHVIGTTLNTYRELLDSPRLRRVLLESRG